MVSPQRQLLHLHANTLAAITSPTRVTNWRPGNVPFLKDRQGEEEIKGEFPVHRLEK